MEVFLILQDAKGLGDVCFKVSPLEAELLTHDLENV